MQFVEANGGARIPAIGLGTWELRGRSCARLVEQALKLGYRHIDTAQVYENEREVGEGLRASGVKRDDVFVARGSGSNHGFNDRPTRKESTEHDSTCLYRDGDAERDDDRRRARIKIVQLKNAETHPRTVSHENRRMHDQVQDQLSRDTYLYCSPRAEERVTDNTYKEDFDQRIPRGKAGRWCENR